jgi:hypothetical protein
MLHKIWLLTVGLAAVLVFIACPARPSAQLNLLKFKLRTKVEKHPLAKTAADNE